jgi:hypothetical protein
MAEILPFTDYSNPTIHQDEADIAYTLFGVLQLANKFLIHDLKTLILDSIRKDWPTTLQGWDERELLFYRRWEAAPHRPMDSYAPEAGSVIRVARLFPDELRSILPIVFYHLSPISVDASYPNHHAADSLKLVDYSPRSARVEILDIEDRFKALVGRENAQLGRHAV